LKLTFARNDVDEQTFSNKASWFLTFDVVQLAIISLYTGCFRRNLLFFGTAFLRLD